jgi:hypothetical protein
MKDGPCEKEYITIFNKGLAVPIMIYYTGRMQKFRSRKLQKYI